MSVELTIETVEETIVLELQDHVPAVLTIGNIPELRDELDSKVDKEAGKSLVSDTEIEKLLTVEQYATANRPDAQNADKVHEHVIADVTGLDEIFPIRYSSGTKNQFDKNSVIKGYWLAADQPNITPRANSVVSGYIPVRGWEALSVSGIPATTSRQWAFFNEDATTIVSRGYFLAGVSERVLMVPPEAHFFLFTISQNSGLSPDMSALQVERGGQITPFVEFEPYGIGGMGNALIAETGNPPVVYTGTKNLFDKGSLINQNAANVNGTLVYQEDSASVILYVGHISGKQITISGLPDTTGMTRGRFYNFYSTKPLVLSNVVGQGQIHPDQSIATIGVPEDAKWMAFSPRQNNTNVPDYSLTQIELGGAATEYEPFTPRVIALGDVPIAASFGPGEGASSQGGAAFLFGDSITQVTRVDSGIYQYPDAGFSGRNWPDYAISKISPDECYSFAKTGASFATKSATSDFQHFENQITVAADYAELNSLTPRWLIVSLGTNDGPGLNQDFDVVMGKELSFDTNGTPITTLDATKSLEAARLGFARLRWHFPQTVMFCALPLQRASYDRGDQMARHELLTKVARCYGFEVIDCFGESGIVHEFEASGVEGRDLHDGLHTNESGKRKQGELIAARVISRLT